MGEVNAYQRALEIFCDELDLYLDALVAEGYTYDEAIDEAMLEYDEVWRVIYQRELEEEDIKAK